MKKTQVSTEFMFALGVVLMELIVILAINFEKGKQLNVLKDFVGAREECLKISNSLNSIFINGPKSSFTFNINYNTTIYNDSRIQMFSKKDSSLLSNCFYTGKIDSTYQNLANNISFSVNKMGVITTGVVAFG